MCGIHAEKKTFYHDTDGSLQTNYTKYKTGASLKNI